MASDAIVLTVYSNGIQVGVPSQSFGFYRTWAEYFKSLCAWRFDVSVRVRYVEAIFLPR